MLKILPSLVILGTTLLAFSPDTNAKEAMGYSVIANADLDMMVCYMQKDGRNLNLNKLCGLGVAVSSGATGFSTSGSGGFSGGGSSRGSNSGSGNCETPDDRASDGSRCGGRAASERQGGRLENSGSGSNFAPQFNPSGGNPTDQIRNSSQDIENQIGGASDEIKRQTGGL